MRKRFGADALAATRKPEEEMRRKVNLQSRWTVAGTAEAKFTLVNAVRVAGPDRILFALSQLLLHGFTRFSDVGLSPYIRYTDD